MKIAIIHPFFLPQLFGIEKVILGHARYLAKRGHEVHVVTSAQRFPTGRFSNLPQREFQDGFTIHRIRVYLRSPSRMFYYLTNSGVILGGLSKLLKDLGPDVVHVHNVASPMWSYLAARYAKSHQKKYFYSLHYHPDGLSLPRWHTALVRYLNVLPLQISRRLYHLTRLDFDLFAREYPKADATRFAVLPNGVDPALDQTVAHEALAPTLGKPSLRILFVGRVEDHRKGFDILEKSYAQVMNSNWILTVVGQIGLAKKMALEASFGGNIRVLGTVDELVLEREYAQADLFVMPARYEGFGMPYIEAMRYGVPVIGTTAGGIPETVPPGTGILVRPDDVDALSTAIKRLAESKSEREQLGMRGKSWAERFAWNHIVDGLENDYVKC